MLGNHEKAINFALLFFENALQYVLGGCFGKQGVLGNNRQVHTKSLAEMCEKNPGGYSSGQRGQTVNLLTYVFTGSNPVLPTPLIRNLEF